MTEALSVLDARTVRRWFEHALRSLLAVREQVDVLNVFPVPDGDTGTNLVLTLSGAADAAAHLPPGASLTRLTATAARGALVNARGNSGVILSQAMRGLARGVAGLDELDSPAFAEALTAAAAGAREAVERPVEGTILTVADAAAAAASEVADQQLLVVVRAAVRAAVVALEDTRGQLQVLTEREVVDAGAAGYVILLGALEAIVDGGGRLHEESTRRARETLADLWSEPRPVPAEHGCSLGASVVGTRGGGDGGAFEVMYVLRAGERDATALRARLDRHGDSVAVVGGIDDGTGDDGADAAGAGDDGGLWQVHVHTDDPAAVLADPAAMRQVCVRSLHAPALAVVATSRVPGLIAPLAQTGAGVCLFPDDDGLRRAVVDTGAAEVLVLPCDADAATVANAVFPAARADGERGPNCPDAAATDTDAAVTPRPAPSAPLVDRQRVHVLDSRDECVVLGVVGELALGPVTDRQLAVDLVSRGRGAQAAAGEAGAVVADLLRADDEFLTVVTGARLAGAAEVHTTVLAQVRAVLAERAPSAELVILDGGQESPDVLLGAQ